MSQTIQIMLETGLVARRLGLSSFGFLSARSSAAETR